MSLNPLDVASFLEAHPEFFQEHAEVLNRISLISPHGNRAVSLQERQMEMLREKIKSLELRTAELIRFGQENDAITEKTIKLARKLFLERSRKFITCLRLRFESGVPLWVLTNRMPRRYHPIPGCLPIV